MKIVCELQKQVLLLKVSPLQKDENVSCASKSLSLTIASQRGKVHTPLNTRKSYSNNCIMLWEGVVVLKYGERGEQGGEGVRAGS